MICSSKTGTVFVISNPKRKRNSKYVAGCFLITLQKSYRIDPVLEKSTSVVTWLSYCRDTRLFLSSVWDFYINTASEKWPMHWFEDALNFSVFLLKSWKASVPDVSFCSSRDVKTTRIFWRQLWPFNSVFCFYKSRNNDHSFTLMSFLKPYWFSFILWNGRHASGFCCMLFYSFGW